MGDAKILTYDQRVLLEDKYVLWDKSSREGAVDLRDYYRRSADALKAALAIVSASQVTPLSTQGGQGPTDHPPAEIAKSGITPNSSLRTP
jgi:hypothetical protein